MKRWIIGWLVMAFLLWPFAAMANETGKKHTAIATGAGSVLMFLTHHKTAGVLSGAAAVWSYSQYQREHQHNKQAKAYQQGYQQGKRAAHSTAQR